MQQQLTGNSYILLLIAAAAVILLAMLAPLAVIVIRYRALRQASAMHQAAILHQKALIHAAVDSQEKERSYIGGELHDNIVHSITLLKFAIIKDDKKAALDITDKAIWDIRALSHRLSPVTLQLFGMEEALRELVEHLQDAGIQMHLDVSTHPDAPAIPATTALHIYRIIQELTINTVKYASAKNIHIQLQAAEGQLQVAYSDDGLGFDYTDTKVHGNGIHNILSRIQLMGAGCSFGATPGKGVQVVICIPLATCLNELPVL